MLNQKVRKIWLPSILIASCFFANFSAFAQSVVVKTGNAVVTSSTIENAVRKIVAQSLKGSFLKNELIISTKPITEVINFAEPGETFREILRVLGLQRPLTISIAPLKIKMGFPQSAIKIEVKAQTPGRFLVKAHIVVTKFVAESTSLGILVPPGLYDQAFQISSTPVHVGLTHRSPSVKIDLSLIATLGDAGTAIDLTELKTNLNDANAPEFFLKLGQLQVNGKPLELQLLTNGQTLTADEPSIREQFQLIEPNIIKTIRTRLTETLEERFVKLSDTIQNEKPFSFNLDMDYLIAEAAKADVIAKVQDPTVKPSFSPEMKDLFSGIKANFLLSYLQYVKSADFFNAQVSSSVCIEGQCLEDKVTASPIQYADLKAIGSDQAAIVIYASWLQNLIDSKVFQQRLHAFIEGGPENAGTHVAKEGVRVHLNPATQSLDLILNLAINIRETAKSDPVWTSRLLTRVGATLEQVVGAGKLVHVPVQISLKWGGIKHEYDAKLKKQVHYIALNTTLPFKKDYTVVNSYHYPCNLAEMTATIRKPLFEKLRSKIQKTFASTIKIPIPAGEDFKVEGFTLRPKKVVITPNGGFMLSGGVE